MEDKIFIEKVKIDKYYSETFIVYYDSKSHIEKLEENMTNIQYIKTQVTIGDNGTLNLTNKGYWFSYQKYDKSSILWLLPIGLYIQGFIQEYLEQLIKYKKVSM